MSNLLAALMGGVGAGAQSYGGSLQREQEQTRMQAQRMAEMQEQESARRRLAKEDDDRTAALKLTQRAAGVNSIRALHPDAQIPDGDFDPGAYLRVLEDRSRDKRYETGQTGMADRLERTLGGRLDQIEKQGGISRDIADANNTTRRAIAALMENGRNTRDDPPKDKEADAIARRALELMEDQPDGFGGKTAGMDGASARARAEREVHAAFGVGPQRGASPPPAPTGSTMMRGLGLGGAASASTLSPEDRQRAARDPAFAAWLAAKGHK